MATKSEIESKINDRLDTDYQWSNMPKNDLEEILDALQDEKFVKKVVAQYANDKAGDTVEEQIDGWEPGSMLSLFGELQNGESNPADMLYNL